MADASAPPPTVNEHAQALADEHELDVAALVADGQITATGKTGDVLKGDVEAYLSAVAEAAAAEKAAAEKTAAGKAEAQKLAAEAEAAEKAAAEKATSADDGMAIYTVAGDGQISTVVGGANRLLHPGARHSLPSADPAVRALVEKGALVKADA